MPLAGAPEQRSEVAASASTVAVLGPDYVGLRPALEVSEGDRVRRGQALFTDKSNPGVNFTSPATGTVRAIHRGARRALQAIVIELDADDSAGVAFEACDADGDPARLRALLLASGQWTAFRTRPYSRVPAPQSCPRSIFVTAIDTNPLCADPTVVIAERAESFAAGTSALATLTQGPVYVCTAPDAGIPVADSGRVRVVQFDGPHPAGLAGTHIHFLDPVGSGGTVWHIGYQDVIAIGELLATGRLWVERVVAFAGPLVRRPRLLRTRLGVSTEDLVAGELQPGEARVISGSVLSGRHAHDALAYLGRYDTQVSVLAEGRARRLLGWVARGRDEFSITGTLLSGLGHRRSYAMTTSLQGSPRAMVPIGVYESVMPLDILPTQLLRALLVQDTSTAQRLGCLELDEEDLALCSLVCPGKYDYGSALRANLDRIAREG